MLKAVLDKAAFDALEETIQAFYTEKDGKYYLTVTASEGFELTNTVNLKASLVKERTRADSAEKKVKKFETDFEGITDPAAARDALGRVDELANFDPDKKLAAAKEQFEKQLTGKTETERKKMITDHETETSALKKKNEVYKSQLQLALVTNSAQSALIKADAEGDGKLLLPHVVKQVRMVEKDDNTFEVEVIDDENMARLTPKGGSTAKMTIPELVEEMKTNNEFAHGFKGTRASGGGTAPSAGGGVIKGGKIVLSKAESRDVATYRAAKARGVKEGKEVIISDQ